MGGSMVRKSDMYYRLDANAPAIHSSQFSRRSIRWKLCQAEAFKLRSLFQTTHPLSFPINQSGFPR